MIDAVWRYAQTEGPAHAGRAFDHFDRVTRTTAEERVERLASLLDDRWRLPVVGWRFGLDSALGFVPIVGDVATTALSAYIVAEAVRQGVPRATALRMVANLALDATVGAVPVVGDLADFGFKANRKNIRLLREHLARTKSGTARAPR